jgi:tetratricopeptide repeat protein 21B
MGDIKKALSILRAVNPDNSYYAESRKLMAEIYLNNLKDRRHFAQCYIVII